MYLSKNKINTLSKIFNILSRDHCDESIRTTLGELILSLLDAQYFASFIWNPELKSFNSAVKINMSEENIEYYIKYYQFNDPITHKLQKNIKSTLVSDVIDYNYLLKTEFFNDFLQYDGLHWGVNFYAWEKNENIGDMRIWRDNKHENFNFDDIALIDMIGPSFTSFLSRSNHQNSNQQQTKDEEPLLKLLSPREKSIASLITQGYSDKEIAKTLAISPTTVRTHINNAFGKADASNRIDFIYKLKLLNGNMNAKP